MPEVLLWISLSLGMVAAGITAIRQMLDVNEPLLFHGFPKRDHWRPALPVLVAALLCLVVSLLLR